MLVTFLLLLFGEILPKVLAQTMHVRFACLVARPLSLLRWIFYPLSYVLVRTSSRISEKASHRSEISLDELADAVDIAQNTSHEEHDMLSGIVNFVNTEVGEIMKPRMDIASVSLTDDYEQVKKKIIESGFSRIPVCEEDIDHIRGTLYVKDLLPYINRDRDFDWRQLIRKPYFVPEYKKINDLLGDFQSNKVHMALVVDAYESFFTALDERTYLFDGKTHIGDFERVLELGEETFSDVRGGAETLAGLILELKRDFPKKGDAFATHGIRFTVQSIEAHRIDKIKVRIDG